jgi:hypothetical protein
VKCHQIAPTETGIKTGMDHWDPNEALEALVGSYRGQLGIVGGYLHGGNGTHGEIPPIWAQGI